VGDDDDRMSTGGQMTGQPVDALHVEVVGRLVEHQQVGPLEQRAGDRHPLLLPTRELGDRPLPLFDAQPVEQLARLVAGVPPAQAIDALVDRRELLEQLLVVRRF